MVRWDMWVASTVDIGYIRKFQNKDDLIAWLLEGYIDEQYVWGATKREVLANLTQVVGFPIDTDGWYSY